VIVPLFYDGIRIGGGLASASALVGEIVFLLCTHDTPHGHKYGTLGPLVLTRRHPDGRHRAVFAYTACSLRTPGLDPVPAASDRFPKGF
jgi:hypothetical protein